jgi:hypothetical protein
MRAGAFLVSSLCAVFFGTPAAAGADPPPFAARAEGTRVAFSLDLWTAQDFRVATMGLEAQIALGRHLAIDVEVPWAVGSLDVGGAGLPPPASMTGRVPYAYLGDVTLGGHGVLRVFRDAALDFGAAVSVPTRYDFTASTTLAVFAGTAAESRGYYDAYRLAPQTLSVRFPVGFEARFLGLLYGRAELDPDIWVPVGKSTVVSGTQLTLEHALEVEARAPFGVGGGLRFQAVFLITDGLSANGADYAQTAIEPFVGYEPPGAGFFARFGVLFALNAPLGFGFDKDKLATFRTQLGGKF